MNNSNVKLKIQHSNKKLQLKCSVILIGIYHRHTIKNRWEGNDDLPSNKK